MSKELKSKILSANRVIEITIIKKKKKSIRLSVHPDLSVKVSAPLFMSYKEILDWIETRKMWIIKKLHHFETAPKKVESKIVSGGTAPLLGVEYSLLITPSKINKGVLADNVIHLYSKNAESHDYNKKVLSAWYKEQAKEIIPQLFEQSITDLKLQLGRL